MKNDTFNFCCKCLVAIRSWAFVILFGEDVWLSPPRSSGADIRTTPPLVKVFVISRLPFTFLRVVSHRTKSAEKVGVYKFSGALPLEIFVVQLIVSVQKIQIISKFFGGWKVINMDI